MIATVTLNPSLDEWIHLPSLRLGGLNRATAFRRYPGGKGINVSRVIHELGGKTTAFALAGGEDGLILRKLMNRLSIRHDFVEVSGLTRNNYKILTAHPHAFTEVNAPGPTVSGASLAALRQRIVALRPAPRCVVLSGSLPPGAPDSTYQQWIRALQRRGIPSVLDTSGAALQQGLRGRPWLIKPNREEAEQLLQRRLTRLTTHIHAVQQLLQRGPTLVILSLGGDGALMGSDAPRWVWLARPPSVKVDSAVGAGDSLVGGFLVGWVGGQTLVESLRLGMACGTATAMTPGTELCHRSDVRRLLRRVTITRVA